MKPSEAHELGSSIRGYLQRGEPERGLGLLLPVLQERTPFPILGTIGQEIAASEYGCTNTLLELLADTHAEGAWVVIACALKQRLPHDAPRAFVEARQYVIRADIWYAADIFAERVPGPALCNDFHYAIELLSPWREDDNIWIRRMVGVAAHHWAKRARGEGQHTDHVKQVLTFLEPCFSEWEMPAARGIAWGLKTLGRYYPAETAKWLCQQVGRRHRTLMRKKALTYLPADLKDAVQRSLSA